MASHNDEHFDFAHSMAASSKASLASCYKGDKLWTDDLASLLHNHLHLWVPALHLSSTSHPHYDHLLHASWFNHWIPYRPVHQPFAISHKLYASTLDKWTFSIDESTVAFAESSSIAATDSRISACESITPIANAIKRVYHLDCSNPCYSTDLSSCLKSSL